MPFRFVHTADIHLDSPLRSLALRDPALAERVGAVSRRAFSRIVDLCLAEQVDALLIAGDLYDGDQTSMKTAGFLATELRRLDAQAIRTFVIRGNHDALSRLTRELVLPPSVHLFGARGDTVTLDRPGRPVVLHGVSFAQTRAPDSLLGRFLPPVAGAINIGMLHTSLGGAPGHDVYAPCSVAELQATGLDYWALGHIHRRAVYTGRGTVVMPGMPQGRDIGEAGEKSVSLITLADDGTATVVPHVVAPLRFERINVAVEGCADWEALVLRLRASVQQARRERAAEDLVLRLRLTGATALAWRVRRDLDLLRTEAQVEAEGIGSVWIEKLETATTDSAGEESGAALAELGRLVRAALPPGPGIATALATMGDDVLRALPPELRRLLGETPGQSAERRAELLAEGAETVLARLRGTGEGG